MTMQKLVPEENISIACLASRPTNAVASDTAAWVHLQQLRLMERGDAVFTRLCYV